MSLNDNWTKAWVVTGPAATACRATYTPTSPMLSLWSCRTDARIRNRATWGSRTSSNSTTPQVWTAKATSGAGDV